MNNMYNMYNMYNVNRIIPFGITHFYLDCSIRYISTTSAALGSDSNNSPNNSSNNSSNNDDSFNITFSDSGEARLILPSVNDRKEFILYLDSYINTVYDILGKYVIYTNESLDIDEFIDFKKSTLLKITKINKEDSTMSNNYDNSDLNKEDATKSNNSCLIKEDKTKSLKFTNFGSNFSLGINSKRFYSASPPAQAKKLVVNSNYNKIIFVDNQSILLLSGLLDADLPKVKHTERVKLIINDLNNAGLYKSDILKHRKPFFNELEIALSQLNDDYYYYNFDFYFYIASKKFTQFEVFTLIPYNPYKPFDFFSFSRFIKNMFCFGYFNLTSIKSES